MLLKLWRVHGHWYLYFYQWFLPSSSSFLSVIVPFVAAAVLFAVALTVAVAVAVFLGFSYTGAFLDGYFHGHGREVYPDGSVYEGDFVAGKR